MGPLASYSTGTGDSFRGVERQQKTTRPNLGVIRKIIGCVHVRSLHDGILNGPSHYKLTHYFLLQRNFKSVIHNTAKFSVDLKTTLSTIFVAMCVV
jgi:hypothetical protein